MVVVALCEEAAQVTTASEREAPGDVGVALARVPASSQLAQKRVGQHEHPFASAVARRVVETLTSYIDSVADRQRSATG